MLLELVVVVVSSLPSLAIRLLSLTNSSAISRPFSIQYRYFILEGLLFPTNNAFIQT